MPQLYFIPAAGDIRGGKSLLPLPPVNLLRDTDDEPTHEEIMAELSPPSGIWEHVSILADGNRMHLFCDDNGLAFKLPPNLRASLLYANATLKMSEREPYSLDHILTSSEASRFCRFADYQLMSQRDLFVVGDCLLWTGEMT